MTTDAESAQQQTREARGLALKKARKAAGLSAADLAERVSDRTQGNGITLHAIYSYERGKVLLSREVGLRIAEVLNLHPGQLLLGDPDYRPTPAPGSGQNPSTAPFGGGVASEKLNDPEAELEERARFAFDFLPTLPEALDPAEVAAYEARQEVVGVDPHQRLDLVRRFLPMLPIGQALGRLLDTAQPGPVDISEYLAVFHLLLADLKAALNCRAAGEVRGHGEGEPNDQSLALLAKYQTLHDDTLEALMALLDPDKKPIDQYKACTDFRAALDDQLGELRKQAIRCTHELPGCAPLDKK